MKLHIPSQIKPTRISDAIISVFSISSTMLANVDLLGIEVILVLLPVLNEQRENGTDTRRYRNRVAYTHSQDISFLIGFLFRPNQSGFQCMSRLPVFEIPFCLSILVFCSHHNHKLPYLKCLKESPIICEYHRRYYHRLVVSVRDGIGLNLSILVA